MSAAGIISNHSANGATAVRGRIRSKDELVRTQLILQSVKNDARLDAGKALFRIDFEHLIHVLRKIQHDGNVTALAGQTRTTSTREHGSAELAAGGYGCNYVIGVARNYQPNRNLPVIRAIGGIECPAATIKPHFSADVALELDLKFLSTGESVYWFGMRAGRKRSHFRTEKNLTADELLFGRYRFRCFGRCKRVHCSRNAAFLVRHAGQTQPHLNSAQSSHQHQVVEVSQMSDAKYTARKLREPGAQRHVGVFQDDLAKLVSIMPLGYEERS